MKRFILYMFKVFYASDSVVKYPSGFPYIMALLIGTGCILMTIILIASMTLAASPDLYKTFLANSKHVNDKVFAIAFVSVIFIVLRLTVREDAIKDASLDKEEVKRVINYSLAYVIGTVLICAFLAIKFLRHYKEQDGRVKHTLAVQQKHTRIQ